MLSRLLAGLPSDGGLGGVMDALLDRFEHGVYTERLRAVEDDYRSGSRDVTLDAWLARPAAAQALEAVARLTAAVQ